MSSALQWPDQLLIFIKSSQENSNVVIHSQTDWQSNMLCSSEFDCSLFLFVWYSIIPCAVLQYCANCNFQFISSTSVYNTSFLAVYANIINITQFSLH